MAAQAITSTHEHAPLISVVIVNFNGWPDTTRLVASLSESREVALGTCEIVVVDNASAWKPPPSLSDAPARLVWRADNGGFSAGVNDGWRAARGRWLLLLNPDVQVPPDFLTRVISKIEQWKNRGTGVPAIVGFGLRNPDGSPQASVGAEPTLLRLLLEPFLPRARRKYRAFQGTRTGPVPWVTGACALVDCRLMEALNGLDEEFFLYYEEVAFCRSARDRGHAVEFDPSISVVHMRPLQNRTVPPGLRVITRHSRLVFFRKHAPHWQFRLVVGLSRLEAWLRGTTAAWRGDQVESRAWEMVGWLARRMARGQRWNGTEVRDLAARLNTSKDLDSDPHRRLTGHSRHRHAR